MNNLSIFGAGFILGRYAELFGGDIVPREMPYSNYPNILYGISTTDNYHIFTEPYKDINTNLRKLVEVLEATKAKFGEKVTFNFLSSWFVYGHQDKLPVNEAAYCDPKGFYSITKRAAEQLLISYCETFHLKYRIFRLANVLGVGDKKFSAKKNALQYFVHHIVNNLPCELYWPNYTVRDYIHVDDACRAIHMSMNTDLVDNQIVNIGNNVPIRFANCIDYTTIKTGNDPVTHRERPDFHKIVQTDEMWLDNTRIKLLGYKPEHSIYQTLDELMEYYERLPRM